ncbi:hypothetical protein HanXRQr2_Chr09g0365211 [Helianthus annuus]|uniref:Transmembrane protein n=1 Tax=Helianthus annuus TaxID=4232 RepID=A0A9K3I370_HELAN|nr:hypothetical protein HanXRQr2_Chr09g0365211 [Helianthus annuus]
MNGIIAATDNGLATTNFLNSSSLNSKMNHFRHVMIWTIRAVGVVVLMTNLLVWWYGGSVWCGGGDNGVMVKGVINEGFMLRRRVRV